MINIELRNMGKRWLIEKRRDYYYRKAKHEKYRSRAAYKLMQLNRRFKILKPGYRVLELGAAPGGWTQVARDIVGDSGFVVGVDLQHIEPLPYENVVFIKGDFTSPEVREKLRQVIPTCEAVISDASPAISGVWSIDHARSVELCEKALSIAEEHLSPGGALLVKVFQGEFIEELVARVKRCFSFVKLTKPKASRSGSAEIYLIAKGFSPVKKGEVYEVEVEEVSRRGEGIAYIDGVKVFIKGAAKGERVKVRIKALKKGFAEGELC
ncbi:SAM-dependent methyltransferase [Candidatus Pyrohabitans sp.]